MENIINFEVAAGSIAHQPLTFRSEAMQELVGTALRYARSSAAVLITGESGTGKELFSRLIHQHSPRASRNLVAVHCGAMSEPLLDAELFGHDGQNEQKQTVIGDTRQNRHGHFHTAQAGSMLLDEIDATPLGIQSKLLRVIEQPPSQRIGRNQFEPIDVRIIATSNRNLHHEIAAGNFRLDLFHRLNVLHIDIPPLRERPTDIPPLVNHFVKQFRSESSQFIHGVTAAAMQQLCDHTWPGNVRELRNVIHRACLGCTSHQITVDDLPAIGETAPSLGPSLATAGRQIAEVGKSMILAALKRHSGNKTAAAAELGVTARTLSNKLKLYEGAVKKAA
jgi:DNA-binding NtrC family response regulator